MPSIFDDLRGCTCGRSSGPCNCRQQTPFRDLSSFSDEEIAKEYHWRALRKLGDQRTGVSGAPVRHWRSSDFDFLVG